MDNNAWRPISASVTAATGRFMAGGSRGDRRGDKKGGAADIVAARAQRPEIEAIFERYGIR
jgi:hypothetical protein